jgi:hypothetical protein
MNGKRRRRIVRIFAAAAEAGQQSLTAAAVDILDAG